MAMPIEPFLLESLTKLMHGVMMTILSQHMQNSDATIAKGRR
jgi:hypothetical protein